MANVVNATGIVGMIGLPRRRRRLPTSRPVRSGVALVEDDDAGGACGLGVQHLHAEVAASRAGSARSGPARSR